MGVDSYIFAVRANKMLDVDRQHNILTYGLDDDVAAIAERLRGAHENPTVTSAELQALARANIASDEHRAVWNRDLLEFAQAFPDDIFFEASDHQDPSCFEIRDGGGYEEWISPRMRAWKEAEDLRRQNEPKPPPPGPDYFAKLEALVKAIEAGGYKAEPGKLRQGDVLQIVDLNPVMRNTVVHDPGMESYYERLYAQVVEKVKALEAKGEYGLHLVLEGDYKAGEQTYFVQKHLESLGYCARETTVQVVTKEGIIEERSMVWVDF